MKDIDPLEYLSDINMTLNNSPIKAIEELRKKYDECGTKKEREDYISKLVDNAHDNYKKWIS